MLFIPPVLFPAEAAPPQPAAASSKKQTTLPARTPAPLFFNPLIEFIEHFSLKDHFG
jgi:hypothetical protein